MRLMLADRRTGGFSVSKSSRFLRIRCRNDQLSQHKFKRPSARLAIILKSPESTTHEGQAALKVYISLDSLYTSILQEAFPSVDAEDDAMVRLTLGTVVLATNPLSPSAIAALMVLMLTRSRASSSQFNRYWYCTTTQPPTHTVSQVLPGFHH